MKLLGLDIGEARIGVAIAEDSLVASFGIINVDDFSSALKELSQIVRQEKIDKIVVGIPKSKNPVQQDKIYKFVIELTKLLSVEIAFTDETLTSKEAERQLENQHLDVKSVRYKEEVDKLSAKMILEQYLQK